jgi:hypothetical protein
MEAATTHFLVNSFDWRVNASENYSQAPNNEGLT